jgi:flagellin-like protein
VRGADITGQHGFGNGGGSSTRDDPSSQPFRSRAAHTMKEITMFELSDDDRGVSPVIGVILMVAITVILAAVIASFVLGFGDSVSENVQAGADISQTNDGNASVTWISEGNAAKLNVTSSGSTTFEGGGDGNLSSVGESVKIVADSETETTITVTAIGSGGSRTVVTQEEVTVGTGS